MGETFMKTLLAQAIWILAILMAGWQQGVATQQSADASSPVIVLEKDYIAIAIQANKLSSQELAGLQTSALAGDAHAATLLGMAYQQRHDATEALKWYHLAADQGSSIAADQIGHSFNPHTVFGGAHGHDPEEALKWYRKAAERGDDAVAEYNVGNLSSELGRDADAVAWLRRATDHGYPLAATNLLWFYDHGRALPGKSKHENWNAGIDLFERLTSEGNLAGQFALASALFDGNLGLKADPQRTFDLLRRVAESGWPRAQYALGNLYFYGKGVAKDKTEAVKWLQKAADQADANAQGFLAEIYLHGDGAPQDLVEAYKWRLLAWRSGVRAPFRKHLDAADNAEAVKRANEWEANHGLARY